jgi:uncharacterized protein YjiS (DUF1127 family)
MNLINFAIASIVDANTGNGISRQFIDQSGSKDSGHLQYGREIRDKSVLGVLAKIKSAVKQFVDDSRVAARARRNNEAISNLSEHLLKDIGLTFVDIQDLKSGQTTLEGLNARRIQYRDQAARSNRLVQSTKRVSSQVVDIDSANQYQYEVAKCA